MPVSYKLFILAKIRSVDPFLYLDLAPACLLTFMDLQKILKSSIFIETSQWEKSAEPRTEVMNLYVVNRFYMKTYEVGRDFYEQFEERLTEGKQLLSLA